MKWIKTSLLVIILLSQTVPASCDIELHPKGDALTQGLWWLYQLQYKKSRELFDQYCQQHPSDPAGYFYKTAVDWWELAQKLDFHLPDVEELFEADYQKTVEVSKALLQSASNDKTRARAYLYWGGAEGLKGRWLVTQREWVNAYFLGKKGNKFLHRALAYDPTLYDADLGIGIYDYFTDTLPGVQGVLAYLFIHGDKKRGLQELQLAIDKGEHARVEAQMFLIEIYTSEEYTPDKALAIAEELHREFPTSPAMHLAVVTVLYTMKEWPEMMQSAQQFLERSEKQVPYYTHEGIRPAKYCLGLGELYWKHNADAAFAYMNEILENVDSSRWVTYAYIRRGQVYDVKGERENALRDYKTAMSRPDFWGSHREAALYLKKPYKY